MKRRLALAPLGTLLVIAAQPVLADDGPWPLFGGCIATADLGSLNLASTVRVTHQTFSNVTNNYNLCFRVVEPDGDVLGSYCQTLDPNHSVTYSIGQLYHLAHVSALTPLAPNLLQVAETDGDTYSHDMQATYGDPTSATARVPMLFTCRPHDLQQP